MNTGAARRHEAEVERHSQLAPIAHMALSKPSVLASPVPFCGSRTTPRAPDTGVAQNVQLPGVFGIIGTDRRVRVVRRVGDIDCRVIIQFQDKPSYISSKSLRSGEILIGVPDQTARAMGHGEDEC